jgi:RNA polymerase sigma-70 factor (ECF subfamily)
LIEAIDALPAPQRETVLLHFEAELTLEEIAQITRTSRETVKSRLRYGVRKIRERLSAQPEACGAQA